MVKGYENDGFSLNNAAKTFSGWASIWDSLSPKLLTSWPQCNPWVWGSSVSSPSGVQGPAPAAQRFCIMRSPGGLFCYARPTAYMYTAAEVPQSGSKGVTTTPWMVRNYFSRGVINCSREGSTPWPRSTRTLDKFSQQGILTASGGSRGTRLGQLPRAPREGAPKRREEQKWRKSA